MLTQIKNPPKLSSITDKPKKKIAIKSFLYRAPKVVKKESKQKKQKQIQAYNKLSSDQKIVKPQKQVESTTELVTTKKIIPNKSKLHEANLSKTPDQQSSQKQTSHKLNIPSQQSIKQVDTYTLRQNLRSKLNRNSANELPTQRYQSPSVFNTNTRAVPYSTPIKDAEKVRKQNTQNIGSGIFITKSDDGVCSITQDMSVYGLSEGSSIQYFNCGESTLDKSFREHMKKVRSKFGKQ